MHRFSLHIILVLLCTLSLPLHAQEASSAPLLGQPLLSPIVDYDPATGNYLYYYSYDTKKTMPYKVLSADDYRREQFLNSLRQGWDKRASKSGGSTTGALEQSQGGLLPTTFSINSDAFKKVFGSNQISVNPQGSLDLLFGINHNYTDNPVIPERYRGNTSFDFRVKMMFNVNASIGDRIKLNWNYNTDATFEFEDNFKIEYVGDEDDILQKVEAGNVNLPLDGTLITGSQSLFGIKTDLRFGKLDLTAIFSRQDAQTKSIEIKGSGQSSVFEIAADKYDANRHFFLNQYFRQNYDQYLGRLPLILSGINIKRVEVWVTNKSAKFDDARNVVAFIDLAEADVIYNRIFSRQHGGYPDSASNNLLSVVHVSQLRDLSNVTSYLSGLGLKSGEDFEKLENARKLNTNEYSVNAQLGYISLNQALNNDEVLAVAYEYEAGGRTYNVGELSTDGITAPNTLAVKLLKGTTLSPQLPTWQLMMKNIYSLDAYSISPKDFIMDVYYENSEVGAAVPYIAEGAIAQKPLLRVLNLDNLNSQHDPYPDGQFDFIEGVTVLASKGKIIFPVLEPFGRYLEKQINNSTVAPKYVYKELYDSTLVKARAVAEKNRFKLVGSYLSEGGDEIRLNATNIPQGSVVVTAGGIQLQENVDYEVNYALGTVRVLNRAYLESGSPIRVTLEDRQLFNLQTKTMMGAHLKYRFDENFYVGATILNLSERPLTQKVNWGNEPVSNTIWGVNTAFKAEAPFITKGLNAIPFFNATKEKSSISFDAEFAQFLPGHSSAIDASGGTVFIDDFEASETSLDLRNINSWVMASTPQGQRLLFPEANLSVPSLEYGFNRARLSWYTIYPEFLRNSAYTPAYIRNNPARYQENHFVREIPIQEIFPEQDQVVGAASNLPVFNMAYYPDEKGPNNYNETDVTANGKLSNPATRWGGIMRSLPVTDFETANYDYVEFWLMDPFVYNHNAKGGKFYLNLGNLSEDVLKDGVKSFENGLPPFEDTARYQNTIWGRVPKVQSLTQTFDNDYAARAYQDVGYDGLDDSHERGYFDSYLKRVMAMITDPLVRQGVYNDPSGDNYKYYLDGSYDQEGASIIDRYKYYNNAQGNSTPNGDQNTMGTTLPDMEDINRDYTMNESESYYQYEIDLSPEKLKVGENYITDSRTVNVNFQHNGASTVTWYQFKVPISEGRAIGAISDLKSIRFIRMFLRGFQDTTIMRMATLQLVRGEWRRYNQSLMEGQEGTAQPELTNAVFDISSVNIEENASRTPVNYVLPPGTSRQIDPGQYQVRQLNEQSMLLKVAELADGDARAAYKNTTFDFRQYERMKMDIHAEAIPGQALRDNDVSVFIRIGTDFRYNYYEYEIPLTLTPAGYYNDNQREIVWKPENKLDIPLSLFTEAKLERNALYKAEGGSLTSMFEKKDGKNIIRIVGNPNLGGVRTLMIGVRNPSKRNNMADDGLPKSTVVWVDELRLTNFDEGSGVAAKARISTKLADLGNVTIAGNMMTPNFGSLESKINERSQVHMYQYDIAANLEFGKFFPASFGVSLPFFFGFMENYTTPKYNPFDQDVLLKDALNNLSGHDRDSLSRMAKDFKQRLAVNFTNVRLATNVTEQKVAHLSNLYLSFSYNRLMAHNSKLDHQRDENYHFNLGYAYNVQPFMIDFFKNSGSQALNSSYLRLIKDLSFNPYPNQFRFNTDINRSYNELQYRNIAAPDIILAPTAAKDFTWSRDYTLTWDLTRSLKLDFSANNMARIDEPQGLVNKSLDPDGYRHWHDSTWTNFWRLGRNVQYYHRYDLTWTVPVNKLPFLEWVNASFRYGGTYDWQAAPLMKDIMYDPGNTIANSRNMNLNVSLNLENLYNKSPYLRSINDEFSGRNRKRPEMVDVSYQSGSLNLSRQKRVLKHKLGTEQVRVTVTGPDGQNINADVEIVDKNTVRLSVPETVRGATAKVTGRVPKKQDPWNYTGKLLLRMAMMVRNISVNYTASDATIVPGFKPNSQLLGMNFGADWAPGWGFVFGMQEDDFVERARQQHWLSSDTTIISPFVMNHTNSWNIRAALEPIRDLKIELAARRSYTQNLMTYNIATESNQRQMTGNFNISVFTLSSAFEHPGVGNDYYSKAFQTFLTNRAVVAGRLASDRAAHSTNGYKGEINPQTGYPDGYGPLSPEVLIPSFLAAYTGQSAGKVTLSNFFNIPIPNWRITYNGLSRLAAVKDVVTSATILHSYQATYAVNSYMLNQKYTEGDDGFSYVRNTLSDFIPQKDLTNVGFTEEFTPLLKVDLGWFNKLSTSVEWRRSRRVSLSMSNNQVTELRSNGWLIGAGYTFREFPVIFKFLNNRSAQSTTSLRLRADLKFQEDLSILRRIIVDNSDLPQISDGKETVTIQCSADYTVSSNIMIRLFFDRVVNTPRVSTIGTATTTAGFSINLSLQ